MACSVLHVIEPFALVPCTFERTKTRRTCMVKASMSHKISFATASTQSIPLNQTNGYQFLKDGLSRKKKDKYSRTDTVFFLDVNSLCYVYPKLDVNYFSSMIALFFTSISFDHPIVAVIDGDACGKDRRALLPSYKRHKVYIRTSRSQSQNLSSEYTRRFSLLTELFMRCEIPVVKIEGQEADDVIATFVTQVLQQGYVGTIVSHDENFRQLLCEDVRTVFPIPALNRWSYFTKSHYISLYDIDPCLDLSFRSMVGDEVDGIPGITKLVKNFGKKMSLRLLKAYGSLEDILDVAAVRIVTKKFAHDALNKYSNFLRRNYQILTLKRDLDVAFQKEWLTKRNNDNDYKSLTELLSSSRPNQLLECSSQDN